MSDRVIQKFQAKWCASCRTVSPLLTQMAAEFGATIVEIDVEDQPEIAKAMEVRSIPTIILYEDGDLKVKRPSIGTITPGNLRETFVTAFGDK